MKALKKLDTNADKWFKSEQEQMRRVHRVYRDSMREDLLAYRANDLSLLSSGLSELVESSGHTTTEQLANNMEVASDATSTTATATVTGDGKKNDKKGDLEIFLPRDSVLRSEKGEMLRPGNCPFKDFETFIQTISIEYWRQNFVEEGHDRMLTEIAESIVSHICAAQASRDLRVRHGSKPLGRFWRAKREQITPLALVMHELKLWATNRLRVAEIMDESTHLEIGRRIKYIQGLQRKEVWGPSSSSLQQGMRPIAHDKLFRLLLTMREDLNRAKEYAFRGYCRRKSREKLGRLGNLLKNVFLNECRVLSLLASFDHIVSEASAPRLQPTDLLNRTHNQAFVDFNTNMVNVCLRAMCNIPLVKCALLADFGGETDERDPLKAIQEWAERNLFCSKIGNASSVLVDPETGLPQVYCQIWESVGEELKNADKKLKPPQKPAVYATHLRSKVFALPADAQLVVEAMTKALAALQDVVPAMYAAHELWSIAGEGGDFTLYDTLRGTVIFVMGDVLARIYALQCAEKNLLELLESLAAAHQDAMEARRLKTKKAEYEPNWIANLRYVQNEYANQMRRAFAETFKQSQEIARDAWDYSLTKNKLDEKINRCRNMGEALCGSSAPQATQLKGDFSMTKVVDLKKKDWIGVVSKSRADQPDFPETPSLESDTAKFKAQKEELDREEDEIKREHETRRLSVLSVNELASASSPHGLGGEDLSDDELEKLEAVGKNPFANQGDDAAGPSMTSPPSSASSGGATNKNPFADQ